jgi:iron(III) transport system substrate-binding protein
LKKQYLVLMLILAMLLALLTVGCGGGTDEVVDTGDGEEATEVTGPRTVTIYTHNDEEEMQYFLEALERDTGIKGEILRMSSGELWSRIDAENPNFGADMVWGMMHSFALLAEPMDILYEYDSPSWTDIPAEFKDPSGRWYGWSYWYNAVAVNTDLIEAAGYEPPASWQDLLDPKWKGEIVAPDPGTSGTAYLLVATIMQLMGEEAGWEYLYALHENIDQYTKSGTAPAQMVAEGEYMIGLSWDMGVYNRVAEGYPMVAVIPTEGVGYDLDVAWIFNGAKNLDTAKAVIDWIGSEAGMKAALEYRGMVTRAEVMEGDFVANFIDYDAVWAAENRERIMERWRDEFPYQE